LYTRIGLLLARYLEGLVINALSIFSI